MTEALERAARAAYEAWIDDVRELEPAWNDLPESHRHRLIQSARAVLLAVREPDRSMIIAGNDEDGYHNDGTPFNAECTTHWYAMIDAILGEKK